VLGWHPVDGFADASKGRFETLSRREEERSRPDREVRPEGKP
jgi:hypothetical protein